MCIYLQIYILCNYICTYKLKCASFRRLSNDHRRTWSSDHGVQWSTLACQTRFRMSPDYGGPNAVGNTVYPDFSELQCFQRHSGNAASVSAPTSLTHRIHPKILNPPLLPPALRAPNHLVDHDEPSKDRAATT